MSAENYETESLRNHYEGRSQLSKGDVDWHPNSWDLMQLWDGIQYPFEKLANPGEAYRQARENTRIYQDEERLYLMRDGEVVRALDENDEIDGSFEGDSETPEIDFDDLEPVSLSFIGRKLDTYYQTISNLEERDEPSYKGSGRAYERDYAKLLNIPNFFKLGNLERSNGYTASETIRELQNLSDENGTELTKSKLKEENKHKLRHACSHFFGSFNDAKEVAGLNTRQYGGYRKFSKPDKLNYFSEIESPDSAYWLGFLYADGSLNSNSSNEIEFRQKISDGDSVRQFKESLGVNNPIRHIETEDQREIKGSTCNAEDQLVISFSSEEIYQDLVKWGCGPGKSHEVIWPNDVESRPHDIPEEYLSDFLRGLFDGDGSNNRQIRERTSDSLGWSIVGNPPLLESLGRYLDDELEMEYTEGKKVRVQEDPDKPNQSRELRYAGNQKVAELYEWMYRNVESGEASFMSRKLKDFVEFDPEFVNNKLKEVQNQLEPILREKEEKMISPAQMVENDEIERI